jgi:hypothetical protein
MTVLPGVNVAGTKQRENGIRVQRSAPNVNHINIAWTIRKHAKNDRT